MAVVAVSPFTAALIGLAVSWGEGEVVGGTGDPDTCWLVEGVAGVEVTVGLDGDFAVFPAAGRDSLLSCCLVADAALRGFCDIMNFRTFWT